MKTLKTEISHFKCYKLIYLLQLYIVQWNIVIRYLLKITLSFKICFQLTFFFLFLRWLKLHSKAGRKEKERGELQVTVQFTRNNMTASMYDLTIEDKPRSTFGKLKDRVTGRKRGDVESSSVILPGRFAALSGSVGPPFAGEGGQDEPDEEEGVDVHRSKVKDFFLKGKLRKNSDTQSCSSLASDGSMASSAGDPFISVELSRTPIYRSKVMEPFRMDTEGGVKGQLWAPYDNL